MPFFGYRWQGLLNRHGNFRDDRLEVVRGRMRDNKTRPRYIDAGVQGVTFLKYFTYPFLT